MCTFLSGRGEPSGRRDSERVRNENEKQLFKCVLQRAEGRLYVRGTIERHFPQFPLFPIHRGTSSPLLPDLHPLFSCFLFKDKKKGTCARSKIATSEIDDKIQEKKKDQAINLNSLEMAN